MPEPEGGTESAEGSSAKSPAGDQGGAKGFWATAKNHSAISAITVTTAVITFVLLILNLPGDLRDGVQSFAEDMGWSTPAPSRSTDPLMTGLEKIEIGMTRDAVAANIGQPLETADSACIDALFCDTATWPDLSMSLYDLGSVEVRALYEDNDLVFVAKTMVDATELPPITYLGWTLGTLGEMTYQQAVSALPDVEPTAFVAHSGPQSAGYGEIFEAGAVSQYRGLYLANAPTGYGTDINLDALSELAVDSTDAVALDHFRSSSQPNTAGEFDAESGPFVDLISENLVTITHFGTEL